MSGFLLHMVKDNVSSSLPWPISFGKRQPRREFMSGSFRLAVRPVVRESGTGFVAMEGGHIWYEGEPRPLPSSSMSLDGWLAGVDGSFRAVFFSDSNGSVTLIADPYASRPVFLAEGHGGRPCASDKLLSLTLAEPTLREIRWEVMLESLALGCVLSRETSLAHVTELDAGTYVTLTPDQKMVTSRYCRHPMDESHPARRSILGDAWALGRALKQSLVDLAPDRDVTILLSGGFDSRWVAKLLGAGRHGITMASGECRELTVAREMAQRCGDSHTTHWISSEKWSQALKYGHLITGGLYNPLKNHFLADAAAMADAGITSVLHAHLFDTTFKGYFVYPPEQFVPPAGSIFPPMAYMTGGIMFTSEYLSSLCDTLSPEGISKLAMRMKTFHETTPSYMAGGYEFGLEPRVLRHISRLMDMPMPYDLMEHFEVKAPIFHKSLWRWWRESEAVHRKPCTAFLLALLGTANPVAWTVKGDTGEYLTLMLGRGLLRTWLPISKIKKSLESLRRRKKSSHVSQTSAPSSSGWGVEATVSAMRDPSGRSILEQGLAALSNESIFKISELECLAESLKTGITVDPHLICFLSSLGWFKKSVLEACIPALDPVPETPVVRIVV